MPITTYDENLQEVGVRKTIRTSTTSLNDIPNGDFEEIVNTELPNISYENETETIKQISKYKRNDKLTVTKSKAKLMIQQEMGEGYMNSNDALIEATLGTIFVNGTDVLPDEGIEKANVGTAFTFMDNRHIQIMADTTSILKSTRSGQFVVLLNKTDDVVLDAMFIISEEDVAGTMVHKLANPIKQDAIDYIAVNPTTVFAIKSLLSLDLDSKVEAIDAIYKKGDPSSKWSNDPRYNGIYAGDDITKLGEGLGTVELMTEILKKYQIKYDLTFPTYDKVNPSPKLLREIINFGTVTAATSDGTVYWELKRQGNAFINNATAPINVTNGDTASDTINAIVLSINTIVASPIANRVGDTIVIEDSSNTYQNLTLAMHADTAGNTVIGGELSYSYLEQDVWEELTSSEYTTTKQVAKLDSILAGGVKEKVEVDLTPVTDFNYGDVLTIVVNGVEYKQVLSHGSQALEDAIANMVVLINVNTTIFKVEAIETFSEIMQIISTAVNKQLNVEMFIDQSGRNTAFLDEAVITKLATYDGRQIPLPNKNFKLDHFYLGNLDDELIDFCDITSIKIDFSRILKDIPCILRENGIAGTNADGYTVYMDVEFTDQDAKRKYDRWRDYKDEQEVSVVGIDVDSGFAFYGKNVLLETFEEITIDGLLGHKIRLNVNYDTEEQFNLALPQFLTALQH